MGCIISKFQAKLQSILNSTLKLKRRSAQHSAHALSLDILEEIFLFVPYECCQNSWIASSKLQIPLASKLKRLRQYQDWIQEQINLLADKVEILKASTAEQKASIEELKARSAEMDASIAELKANSAELDASILELRESTAELNAGIANANLSIKYTNNL
ncbi:hypothetical protein Ddc_19886 [Ditylenchus destructor]|nr:hypothetical protein Ddc_19886 [Ditylenchus destructor]